MVPDNIFITVGTKKQKLLCEKLISDIKEKYEVDITVVSDDDFGNRIGSGGAVLNILCKNYNSHSRLLIINSGGNSKRSINYAIRGKAFANILYQGQIVTLFEMIVIKAKKLLTSFSSGAVICCSDILIDTEDIDIDFENNIGFCVRADFETGSRHGVMFRNSEHLLVEYPHKCDSSKLREMSDAYEYEENSVLIDTGVTYFNDDFCIALCRAEIDHHIIDKLVANNTELNLYSDIISLLAEKCNRKEYVHLDTDNPLLVEIKSILFELLSSYSLKVYALERQKFVHFGSLKEALVNINELSGQNHRILNLNSFVSDSSVIGDNTVLDNVIVESDCKVGSNCFISDISLGKGIDINDNKAVCGIKLCDGSYVAIICDINENSKDIVNSKELWKTPRFYKGKSFMESILKFYNFSAEEKYSMHYCVENADFDYYFTRCQYLKDMRSYTVNPNYLSTREKIINHHFQKNNPITCTECKKDKIEIELPVRVNFSGTWTDAMPFCIDNGGQVVNMAITVDGKKPIKVIVEKLQNGCIELCSDDMFTKFSFDAHDGEEDLSDFNLHIAALKTAGITKDTLISDGFRLTTKVHGIDKGSGLGTSSILLGGCIKALGAMFGIEYSDNEILKMVFVAEQIMKTGGGWQDQVGGLLPSIKVGTSHPGLEQDISVEYIDLPESFEQLFSERLVLMPSGQRHFGRFIVNDVVNRYISGNEESIEAHKKIRELNDELIKSIKDEDFQGFYNALNRHRALLKKISPAVTNKSIDNMVGKCLHVAEAISPCGAGGGGYLLVVLKENISIQSFKNFVIRNFPSVKSSVKKIDICR